MMVVTMQPCKSLVQEKAQDWTKRLGKLGLTVKEVTGNTDSTLHGGLDDADVICTTPEKLGEAIFPFACCSTNASYLLMAQVRIADAITRKRHDQGGMRFFAEVSLFVS